MKQNIHNIERGVRVILGIGILSLVFVGPKTWWGLIGVLPIMTGLSGWCPPYHLNSRVNVTRQAVRRPTLRRGPSDAWLFRRPAIVGPVLQNIQ
jgi:DUF2892 family protein